MVNDHFRGQDETEDRALGALLGLAVGDALVTLEAMKMETTVRAEYDGIVTEVLARVGDALDTGDLLVVIGDGD